MVIAATMVVGRGGGGLMAGKGANAADNLDQRSPQRKTTLRA